MAVTLPEYQDKDGLWYQVLDQIDREGNFPEASVTSQFMYAYAKAVNKGYIDSSYIGVAQKAYGGLRKELLKKTPDKTWTLTRCCAVGGLGGSKSVSYTHLSRILGLVARLRHRCAIYGTCI